MDIGNDRETAEAHLQEIQDELGFARSRVSHLELAEVRQIEWVEVVSDLTDLAAVNPDLTLGQLLWNDQLLVKGLPTIDWKSGEKMDMLSWHRMFEPRVASPDESPDPD